MLTIYLLLATGIILWYFLRHIYSYWDRKGLPYIKPIIPFGNLDSVRKKQKSFGTAIYDLYNCTKEPFIGIYLLFRPAILIRDADLTKLIITKDFKSFHDRGTYANESDPMSMHLFSLPGIKWKQLRSKLTPAFSSGKLKNMFDIIENVSKTMIDYLHFTIPLDNNSGEIVDMVDVAGRFAVDIIANVIFGLDINSFAEPNNPFRTTSQKATDDNFMNNIRSISGFVCPGLLKVIPIGSANPHVEKFMIDIVKKTIEYREKTNYVRKDFMQLLLQLRNTGKLNLDDGMWDVESVADSLKSMPIEECAAQTFLFFIAGSETTSLTISYCLHELTQHPEIMKKLLDDIDSTLEKHNGRITYDSIQEMKYLELCLLETMRMYPGLPILNRECTENFKIPGTKYEIEKGTAIIISLLGLHRDPKYFPEPNKFDPERFTEEKKNYYEPAYIPFGDGPRACIGIRLGKINIKVALVSLLKKYEFEAIGKRDIEFDKHSVTVKPIDGIKLMVKRRRNTTTPTTTK